MKVRIKKTPREDEVDGVRLDRLEPGTVREVSEASVHGLSPNGMRSLKCGATAATRNFPRSEICADWLATALAGAGPITRSDPLSVLLFCVYIRERALVGDREVAGG